MPIADDAALAEGVVVTHPDLVNLYGCRIGAQTRIGPFVEIQKNVVVGMRCKISSHSLLCEGVRLEDEVFIGHGVMFTNDRRPQAATGGRLLTEGDWAVVSTVVHRGASIGSGAVILAGIEIGEGALVGRGRSRDARCGATHDGRRRPRSAPVATRPRWNDTMIGVGVIGFGYWGPNLARNFAEIPEARLIAVCDSNTSRLAIAQRRYPGVAAVQDFRELLADPSIEAIAIATPVGQHFELARACLRSGKHVLVEKPLAASSDQARQLIEEADRQGLVLMVDHTFLYSAAVRKIHELVRQGALGELLYYDSVRVNLGLFQNDVSVVWDLAVHDVAIMDHLLGAMPAAVSACGMAHVSGSPPSLAYLTYFFPGRLIGHVHVNWLAPVKVRRTLLGGNKKMVVYDDLETTEKVKLYDKGVTVSNDPETVYRVLVNYRTGDMHAPHLDTAEALHTELRQFLACIRDGTKSLSDGRAGLRVVRCLEAATQSMERRGRPVDVEMVE